MNGDNKSPYIIVMLAMCTSEGNKAFAIARHAGKIGPYKTPNTLAEAAFWMFELTNQIRSCITSARTACL